MDYIYIQNILHNNFLESNINMGIIFSTVGIHKKNVICCKCNMIISYKYHFISNNDHNNNILSICDNCDKNIDYDNDLYPF